MLSVAVMNIREMMFIDVEITEYILSQTMFRKSIVEVIFYGNDQEETRQKENIEIKK